MRHPSTWILASILAASPLALAHLPPGPESSCNPWDPEHDFLGALAATATAGLTGETGAGHALAYDGCGALVLGDGEYEFGVGGAFLSFSHHEPRDGFYVDPYLLDGGFVIGSDWDGDGDVERGTGDCFESYGATGGGWPTVYHVAAVCGPGWDGGWWLFAKCNATVAPDAEFTTNGALLRGFGDDEDGIPNFAEDDDADGAPNGIEDGDSDGLPDLVNGNWNPTLTPGSIPPSTAASCLTSGHVTSAAGSGGAWVDVSKAWMEEVAFS
ncbi:MAG TPA: hypothetical protein VHH36_09355 [Candidatus Thermoplasmatota archaeon]|nr:hypothetical protein [Candidatus Thermoplasmatota archaeon]